MATKLQIYNRALSFIGTQRLHPTTGLTEDVASRYELDDKYDQALSYMLEQGLWKFAIRTSEMAQDPDLIPSFGPKYAFSIPSDFVRLANISTDEYFAPGSEPDYVEENGYWYSDNDKIYIKYVSNGSAYGLDLGQFPENYTQALCLWLAYNTVLPISKDRGDRNTIFQQYEAALSTARRLNAVDMPVKGKPPGRWVRSRGIRQRVTFGNGRMSF